MSSDINELETKLCSLCGKALKSKRSGSLTSWIFGESSCQCTVRTKIENFDPAKESDIAEEDSNDSFPTVSSRYQLEKLVATGGMAKIYAATDTHLDKSCVVKVMRPEYLLHDASLQRFGHETRMCAGFNHPNLVTVTDYDIAEEGAPYLVMDFVEGSSLRDLIKSGDRLNQEETLSIFIQICNAVEYAHSNGLVHRDIKPENILIQKDHLENFVVKLLDFGIAKPESEGGEVQRLTQTGEVFGSPQYMSPEQCSGENTDERSDIYAIGCIIYEIQTGHPPFRARSLLEILNGHISGEVVRPSSVVKDAWAGLENITLKCLEKKPDNRYQSASSLKEALLKLRNKLRKNWTSYFKPSIGAAFIAALIVIPVLYFTSSNKVEQSKVVDNKPQTWMTTLSRSNLARDQRMYDRARKLLAKGIKEGLKQNAPIENLLSFTAEYQAYVKDTWPDFATRQENYRFVRKLFDSMKSKIDIALKSKNKDKAQNTYVQNLIALNYFQVGRLAQDAREHNEGFRLLKKADQLCIKTPESMWLKIKIETYFGESLSRQESYRKLKSAYDNLVVLQHTEPDTIGYSTVPARLYRELAKVSNKLGRHEEASKYAKLGLKYRGSSVLSFDKNYIATMESELKKAEASR